MFFIYGIVVLFGLFVLVILCGVIYGRIVGMIMGLFYVNGYMDEGVYVFLGVVLFFGGFMWMIVFFCIILLELINNLLLFFLIMFVLLILKIVGDVFNDGFYFLYVYIKGIFFFEVYFF